MSDGHLALRFRPEGARFGQRLGGPPKGIVGASTGVVDGRVDLLVRPLAVPHTYAFDERTAISCLVCRSVSV